MVESGTLDVEFDSVNIPNIIDTSCEIKASQRVKEVIEIEVPTYEKVEIEETVYVQEKIMVPTQVPVDVWKTVTKKHCPCRNAIHNHDMRKEDIGNEHNHSIYFP